LIPSLNFNNFTYADGLSAVWFARHKIPTTRKNKEGKDVPLRRQETETVVFYLIDKWATDRYGDIVIVNEKEFVIDPYVRGFLCGWTNCITKDDSLYLSTPQNQLERFREGITDGARISSYIFNFRT
jgi:hypothetical protein